MILHNREREREVFLFVQILIGSTFHRIIKVKSKLATIVEGDQKAPFSIATTPRYRGGRYSFPG